MVKLMWNLWKEEEGATALEYALLVVLIAIVMSIGAAIFGGALGQLFSDTGREVESLDPSSIANPIQPT
jgi:pilus assembly protein Flp/PilA